GDFHLGRGTIGGPLAPQLEQGAAMAAAAVRILAGERPSAINYPLPYGPPRYDWRELQRWGISESRLPPDSIVEFREPTAWDRYRWQISLSGIALVLQSLLITGLLYERRRRRAAEVEAHRRMGELAHMNRSAAASEMSASIAHEINQPLAAIVSSGYAGLRWLANKTPNIEEAVAAFMRIVSDGHRAGEVIATV